MSTRLRVGMGDSYGLRPVVLRGPDFDPEAVTGVVFHVTKPTSSGGTASVQWTGSIGDRSAASVQALYAFNANGLDLDYPGTWRVWLQWTVPGETPGPRTEVGTFTVVGADSP